MRARNSPGTFSICRPKKSLICVLAMMTAMPLVNPTTTGRGMNFTADAEASDARGLRASLPP